jgi:hypothetical protein
MKLPPAVIVHGLEMAREALAPGLPVTLLSARGAALYAGVGWWQAVAETAREGRHPGLVPDILDCGDAAGRALEALRMRQPLLILRARADIWADVAGRARSVGCLVLGEAPPALDLGRPKARRGLAAWLAGDTGAAIG